MGIPTSGKGIHRTERSMVVVEWRRLGVRKVSCRHRIGTPAPLRVTDRVRQPAAPGFESLRSHISVARRQHGRKPRRLLFAPPLLARLLKMPVITHDLQRPFAVDLLLQPPQCLFDCLAFSKLNFGQNSLTSSPNDLGIPRAFMAEVPAWSEGTAYFSATTCQTAIVLESGLPFTPPLAHFGPCSCQPSQSL